MGEDSTRYDNWLNREFNAEHPNQKWVTDISHIQTQEGVLYLSMIRDRVDLQKRQSVEVPIQNSVFPQNVVEHCLNDCACVSTSLLFLFARKAL